MSRRSALFGALAFGAACGFTPVFGPGGAGALLSGAVEVETPQSVAGFRLGTALIERFGPTKTAAYVLTVTLSESRKAAAQTIAGQNTRFDLTGTAKWVLKSTDGEIVGSGTAQTFASYSASGSTLATQTAERDARTRLSIALADIIASDVVLSVS